MEPRLTVRLRAYEYLRDHVPTDSGRRGTFRNEMEVAAEFEVRRVVECQAAHVTTSRGEVPVGVLGERGRAEPGTVLMSGTALMKEGVELADATNGRRIEVAHAGEVLAEPID